MKKLITAILTVGVITVASANGSAQGNGGSNGMPNKPCYANGEMMSTLMDFYQCKAKGGSQNR